MRPSHRLLCWIRDEDANEDKDAKEEVELRIYLELGACCAACGGNLLLHCQTRPNVQE